MPACLLAASSSTLLSTSNAVCIFCLNYFPRNYMMNASQLLLLLQLLCVLSPRNRMPACLLAASSCTLLSTSRADCIVLLLTCRSENTTQLLAASRPGILGAGANTQLLWLPCLLLLVVVVVAAVR